MVRKHFIVALAAFGAAGWVHSAAAEGDPARGERIFQRCAVCHAVGDATRPTGPSLNNVIGRVAGTLEGFDRYSANMKEAGANGLVWTVETIDQYIENPRRMIPRGTMQFPGLRNAQERADVVAYVAQYSTPAEEAEAAPEGEGEAAD